MKITKSDKSDMSILEAIVALQNMKAEYGDVPILDLEGFASVSLTGHLGKAEAVAFLCSCDCHGCKTRGHDNE